MSEVLEAPRTLPIHAPLFDSKRLANAHVLALMKSGSSQIRPSGFAYEGTLPVNRKTSWSVSDSGNAVLECSYHDHQWHVVREHAVNEA
jgi:hypothetical protein